MAMTPEEFIAAVSPAAKTSMLTTKIPASFVVADGALESGWGTSQLAVQGFNIFGVKASAEWHGPVLTMRTREFISGHWVSLEANWRKYSDWLGSIQDHAAFLLDNPRYKPAFAYTSGINFAPAIQAAGYATDPQYGAKVIAIIKQHHLSALDT